MADDIALGTEDYAQLHGMLTSGDKAQRAEAMSLAGKLTPSEAQQFFDYQKSVNQGKGEMGRVDATLGGVPAELALVGGSTLGKAASAAAGIARVLPEKAIRGVAAAGDYVSPDLIGIASPRLGRAVDAAQRVRGAMRPSAPVEAPLPQAAPVEPAPVAAVQRLSPQRIANELGIAAKRAGVKVTAADDADVLMRVSRGANPADAIADVLATKAPTAPPIDPAEALRQRFGLPTDAERTFPPNKSGLPTKAPRADARYRRAK